MTPLRLALFLQEQKEAACEAALRCRLVPGDRRPIIVGGVVVAHIYVDFAKYEDEVGDEIWLPCAFVRLTPIGRTMVPVPWSRSS